MLVIIITPVVAVVVLIEIGILNNNSYHERSSITCGTTDHGSNNS